MKTTVDRVYLDQLSVDELHTRCTIGQESAPVIGISELPLNL